jgi:hypothetical protein
MPGLWRRRASGQPDASQYLEYESRDCQPGMPQLSEGLGIVAHGSDKLYVLVRDITERKRAELALQSR